MSKKSLIDSIEVKSPCSEDWDVMKGSEQVRFCAHCALEVNNISAMTRKQAMRLVRESSGRICVRYIQNPVDKKPVFAGKLYQITRRAGLAAGVLGASLTLSNLTYAQGNWRISKSSNTQVEASLEKQSKEKTEIMTATVSGTITDQNGAVIPAVTITIQALTFEYSMTTVSNDEGFYKFENVPAGKYKLTAGGKSGFADKEIAEISVHESGEVNQNISLDVSTEIYVLPAGELSTSIMGIVISVDYENPLHRAVSNNDLEEVKILIAKGEDVNSKDENYSQVTPLFLAVENGSAEIAEFLLSFRAKANARDKNRQTPLMRLDEDANVELVRTLFKYGAKIDLTDNNGNTALILAARSAKTEVLQILIDHDARVNAQNKQGQTALMNAAEADNLESVRALLVAGADVNLKNEDGDTAWDLTTSTEIENLLESYGAIIEDN